MREIVINRSYGGFSLSVPLQDMIGIYTPYPKNSDFGISDDEDHFLYRSHPKLLTNIKALGYDESNGNFAALAIVCIPDDVIWTIDEYDGKEWVSEAHRTWE